VNERAKRIEWEHVVPAWEFGHQLQCWQNGGRKFCKKSSTKFKEMAGDMHNLVPAIGEINGDRSNFKFSMIEGEKRVYGQCDAEVDFKRKTFEPTNKIQGNIARTYFYFEKQYGLRISKKQRQLFTAWNRLDPVDQAECEIHTKKAKIQGNVNPFISEPCDK
jgi:deoxyribonuclease-1